MPAKKPPTPMLVEEWTLPASATLGSSVRARGILLEIRAQMPAPLKKTLDLKGAVLTLSVPETDPATFKSIRAIVNRVLQVIQDLPVIPREIQDILTISTTERHRWLKDGRLQSAGTRTVKLRGRAKKITFHVFDPRHVENLLNGDLIDAWREDDVARAAENRRRAAEMRALTRRAKVSSSEKVAEPDDDPKDAARHKLKGWEDFERDGPLR